jgi:hypothetical protein
MRALAGDEMFAHARRPGSTKRRKHAIEAWRKNEGRSEAITNMSRRMVDIAKWNDRAVKRRKVANSAETTARKERWSRTAMRRKTTVAADMSDAHIMMLMSSMATAVDGTVGMEPVTWIALPRDASSARVLGSGGK